MKKLYALILTITATLAPFCYANSVATQPVTNSEQSKAVSQAEIQRVLETMEFIRGFKDSGFSFTSEVLTLKDKKVVAKHLLDVKVSNQGFAMVEILAPKRQQGRRTLMRKNDLWLYLPTSSNVIRIAPLQRVFGSASIADVLNTSFLNDYSVTAANRETGNTLVLELTSKVKGSTYAGIKLSYDMITERPIKTEHFTTSGRLLKTIEYKTFQEHQGQRMAEKVVIYDSLRKNSAVWIKMSGYELSEYPAALFTKSGLKKA